MLSDNFRIYKNTSFCFLIIPDARKMSELLGRVFFFFCIFLKLGHLARLFGRAGWIFPNKDITVVSWQHQ